VDQIFRGYGQHQGLLLALSLLQLHLLLLLQHANRPHGPKGSKQKKKKREKKTKKKKKKKKKKKNERNGAFDPLFLFLLVITRACACASSTRRRRRCWSLPSRGQSPTPSSLCTTPACSSTQQLRMPIPSLFSFSLSLPPFLCIMILIALVIVGMQIHHSVLASAPREPPHPFRVP
jgi:hypothetical protein